MSDGGLEKSLVTMKNIVAHAISKSAASAAIAHNHPSGTLAPSFEDKTATLIIEQLLGEMGLRLIEHYIIANGKYTGMKKNLGVDNHSEILERSL